MRLDKYLTEQGTYMSRHQAQVEIKNGAVKINGNVVTKPSFNVSMSDTIEIIKTFNPYASKGGLKLEAALNYFDVDLSDKHVLDIGSSTGGFTDVLLRQGAKKVTAVDVGKDQMIDALKNDPRVSLYESTNFLSMRPQDIEPVDFLVMDVSFTSSMPLLIHAKTFDVKTMILLIKPQFESLKTPKSGVIKDPKLHIEILRNFEEKLHKADYYINELIPSPIKGGSGNIEFLALINNTQKNHVNIKEVVLKAHA